MTEIPFYVFFFISDRWWWWPEVVAGGGCQRWWWLVVIGGGRWSWPEVVPRGGGDWWLSVVIDGGRWRWPKVVMHIRMMDNFVQKKVGIPFQWNLCKTWWNDKILQTWILMEFWHSIPSKTLNQTMEWNLVKWFQNFNSTRFHQNPRTKQHLRDLENKPFDFQKNSTNQTSGIFFRAWGGEKQQGSW